MGFIRVLWVIFFLGFFLKAHAQTYPVQTNIVAVGPYYNYLNYYADENAHLQIITTLTDFNTAPVNVRLRIQFIGPGYTISTKPNAIIGQAFTLEPGIPLFINGIDLLPYFYETNVVKSPSGINLNSLPEGLTTVCVDVIRDGVSQEVLSTNNCTSFFLQRFQPPQGVFPQCGSNINPDEGFYTFQWSPPIGYVPSIGSELNYTFSLYEWNDPNNYNIFQTGQGLVYQAYIQQPIVQLSNFDLTLQNGKNYVWRVQAQLLSNGLPVNMIENNGLSGICTFTYGTAQTLEESLADGLHIDISAMGEGERKGKASWTVIDNTPGEGLSTFSSYIVYYRKKPNGTEGYELTWFQDTVSTFNHFIYQLEPATTYEVKVAGRVGENYVSEISETKEFTTYNPRAYACGDTDMPFRSQTYQPLAQAQAGMYFQIGQFSMQVTHIQPAGGVGRYKGRGLIPIAFLAGAKAVVEYDNILVDDRYMVREGVVHVTTEGVDAWLHEQYQQFIDPIYVSGTVDSAYVQDNMAWVVIDGESKSWEFDPPDYPIIVNDDSGKQYIIHPNGNITITSYFAILEEWGVDVDEVVTFSKNDNQKFGFDVKEHTQWHENYDIIQLSDSSYYFVPNKSMGKGLADSVTVNFPTGEQISNYTYRINNGASQQFTSTTLSIPAQNNKGDFNLEVFQGTKKVGKLKLIVFEEKQVDLVVVPLVSSTPSKTDIENALKATLGQANLQFNVTIAPQWNNDVYTSSKTIQLPEDVTLFNKYSSDMSALRDAYFEANDSVNKDAFFLFVVPGFSDSETDGYMVRGKSLGFIAANADVWTYAHELGHGAGTLAHSWQGNGPNMGTTSNLMDYTANARTLIKSQWKQIRSWSVLPSMWDDEEDGSLITINGNINESLSNFSNTDESLTFIAPSGKPITLKGQISQITFATFEDRWLDNSGAPIENSYAPIGCLVSFVIDNVYFNAHKQSGSDIFIGYYSNDSIYKDTISRQISVDPIMVLPTYSPSGFLTTAFKLSNPPPYSTEDTSAVGPISNTWDLVLLVESADLNEKVLLPAEFSTNFSLSTISLLNDLLFTNYSNLDPAIYEFYGYEAVAIYNAAYYIETVENAQSCYINFNEVTKILTSEQLKGEYTTTQMKAQIDERNEQLLSMQSLGIYQDNIVPLPITPPTQFGEFKFYTLEGQEEYQRRRLATALSGIRYYNQLISKFSELSDLSEVDFNTLVKLSKIFENTPGLGDCLFLNISPESKVQLLNRITEWTLDDGKEEFLLRVLENTTDEQFALMYDDLFSSDCKLLHNLDGGFWYSHYDRFANRITQLILNYKKNSTGSLANLPTLPLYHDGINPFDSEVECDFDDCIVEFDTQIVGFNNDVSGVFHPADLVLFTIEDNFQFPDHSGTILKIGDTLLAPAFWGYYFLSEHDQHTNWQVFRYFAEAALIIASGGSAAPEIIQVELGILGADIVVSSLRDEYPNNPVLTGISNSLDALSIIIPITGAHSIVKNGITRLPWISKIANGASSKILFYKDEFTLFLRAVKNNNKIQATANYLSQISEAVNNSNLVQGAKQTLLNYLTVAQIEIGILKYTPDPYKARIVVPSLNSNIVQVEIYQTLGNYAAGSRVNIGNYHYDNQLGDYVFSNLVEYQNIYGNITNDFTEIAALKVLQNGNVTTKSYRVVMTESGTLCLKGVSGAGDDLLSFVNKPLSQKLADINTIWNTKYPIPDMLGGRSLLEDIMGHYRYTQSTGWLHTGDISFNFKGIDFYKGTETANQIFANTAVSMKTTIQTDVNVWLNYQSIKDNIKFLRDGMSLTGMIDPNNLKTMFITEAKIHIYMPQANITPALTTQWMNKLTADYPDIIFEIKSIEEFIN